MNKLAPAHAQLAAVQAAQYNSKNYELNVGNAGDFDDGQYDPRYNDPNFEGNLRAGYVQPAAQPQYVPQQQQPIQQQPQQPAYNHNQHLNNINYVSQYQSTTPNPHRFQPPGKHFSTENIHKSHSTISTVRKIQMKLHFISLIFF